METQQLPKAIEAELKKIDQAKEQVMGLATIARMAHAVADVFPDLNIDVSIVKQTFKPHFVCLAAHVDSLKDAMLPVLRDLASRGWHTDKKNPFEDYVEVGRRTFNLVNDDLQEKDLVGEPVYRLRFMLFLNSDATSCRKVKVGEKVEDVYEFVCE